MQKTQHYELKKPDITDPLRVADLNENSDLLDAAIKAVADTAANKAEQSDLEALAAALGTGGSTCRIAYGSYIGTGTYGSSNAVKLNFDFYPVLVLIASPSCSANSTAWPAAFFRGVNVGHYCVGSYAGTDGVIVSWGENSVSYHSNYQPGEQNNLSGKTYFYLAFGYTP